MKTPQRTRAMMPAAPLHSAALTSPAETVPPLPFRVDPQPIPDSESIQFVQGMVGGWNLGNTFDAFDSRHIVDELKYESAWRGVTTQPEVFDVLYQAGFRAVRIPVSWHNHVSGVDFTISQPWLNRVREVINYALDSGLYVILNCHHDISQNYVYPDAAHLESSKRFIAAVWGQLAETFQNYDRRLLFEALNEPRLVGTSEEWRFKATSSSCREAVACINDLNQVFVDTVRLSGGGNAQRYLLVPGYCASANGCLYQGFALPQDPGHPENRLIVSVHEYLPYQFALQNPADSASTDVFDENSMKPNNEITALVGGLYHKFVSKGIPVIIGEYGARNKNGNLQSRVNYAAYYTAAARAAGITCFWWDNHAFSGSGELFGLLNRKTRTFTYPEIVDAIMAYAK